MQCYHIGMTVIIPAAGVSARMGENKLLLPYHDKPLIHSAINVALSYTDNVIVVIGHERERMEEALKHLPVDVVYCEDYLRGQKYSTLRGVKEVDNDDFAILPGDLPLVKFEDFQGTEALLSSHVIARSIYRGIPGHPVMFRKEHKDKLLSFEGTLKEYLSLYDTAAYNGSIGTVFDADTPQRYQALISDNYDPSLLSV